MMTQRLPRVKRLLNKVGSKVLILGYYTPVIVYVYSVVLYDKELTYVLTVP